jgi:putative two-component system response regulator
MDRKLNILAVDDDFINLKLIHSMLKKNDNVNKVFEANNGLEALNAIRDNDNIDMILLDIKMPIMDGMEFMENLQSIPEKKNIPVVVLTTDETRKHEAFENGVFDFLVKPIRENELYEKIDKIKTVL